nr:hypothetical protein [Tanacetum cinerariifolium]
MIEHKVHGDHITLYTQLRQYVLELKERNPDITVKIDVERDYEPDSMTRNLNFTFVTDRQKGLIPALAETFPAAEHRNMKELKARPHCDVLLNNMCEVLIRQLKDGRDKPIITCLEFIREYLMKRIVIVQQVISKSNGPLTPKTAKKVGLDMYALQACSMSNLEHSREWLGTKHTRIMDSPITYTPPEYHKPSGRPSKRRKKSAAELFDGLVKNGKLSRFGQTITCCKCGKKGHISRTYKGQRGATSAPAVNQTQTTQTTVNPSAPAVNLSQTTQTIINSQSQTSLTMRYTKQKPSRYSPAKNTNASGSGNRKKFLAIVETEKARVKDYRKLVVTDEMIDYVLEKYGNKWKSKDEIAYFILEDLWLKYGKGKQVDDHDDDDLDSLDLANRIKKLEEDFDRLLKAKKAKETKKAKKAREAELAKHAQKEKNAKEVMLAEVVQIFSDEDDDEDHTALTSIKSRALTASTSTRSRAPTASTSNAQADFTTPRGYKKIAMTGCVIALFAPNAPPPSATKKRKST